MDEKNTVRLNPEDPNSAVRGQLPRKLIKPAKDKIDLEICTDHCVQTLEAGLRLSEPGKDPLRTVYGEPILVLVDPKRGWLFCIELKIAPRVWVSYWFAIERDGPQVTVLRMKKGRLPRSAPLKAIGKVAEQYWQKMPRG